MVRLRHGYCLVMLVLNADALLLGVERRSAAWRWNRTGVYLRAAGGGTEGEKQWEQGTNLR